MFRKTLILLGLFLLLGTPSRAQESATLRAQEPAALPAQPASSSLAQRYALGVQEVFTATRNGVETLFDKGFAMLGVRYRFGGNGIEDGGIDCSGLVRKVFGDALGMNLPRTAAEMAKLGDAIKNREELKPGDLVFFNTMRRAFSHVGIYLGEDKFLHAPSKGGVVRVERMDSAYWTKRFNGARRLMSEAQAAEPVPSPQPATPVVP